MPLKDISGLRFNSLTVLCFAEIRNKKTFWKCKCDCGTETIIAGPHLKSGKIKSCGCVYKESRLYGCYYKHGEARKTKEYRTWTHIKCRCFNTNADNYTYYGGRGITVCDRWKNSFENFLADMGRAPSPNHSIDRINPNGNYEPGNCRWASYVEQANNRRKAYI